MKPLQWTAIVGLMLLASCSKARQERPADAHETTKTDTGRMSGMPGMGNASMMAGMSAHMDSMGRMSPDQMSQAMATHERKMSQMMDRMGADMRGMHMSGTPEWNALTDSVKQDLAELPGLSGQQLSKRMHAHAERVRRLITSHEHMMKQSP